jgi:lysozyme family protein
VTTAPMFDRAFNKIVLKIEGGAKFVDHPDDSGGATRFGITEETARRFKYTGPMPQLPVPVARDIYLHGFWDPLRLTEVGTIAGYAVAEELFEENINVPFGWAGKNLQQWLNVFNLKGTLWPDIVADGQVGPKTIDALRSFIRHRDGEGAVVLRRALNCSQGEFYKQLSLAREKDESFTWGWLVHRTV